jgi:protein-S-isoprenylcysteine O-methyltransferase Ste14
MGFYILIGMAAGLWLLSCGAAVLGLRWNFGEERRFKASLVASLVSLALGYVGMSRVHLSASRTVNGHVQWSLNSKWFFVAALILGGVSLVFTLWNQIKQGRGKETLDNVL